MCRGFMQEDSKRGHCTFHSSPISRNIGPLSLTTKRSSRLGSSPLSPQPLSDPWDLLPPQGKGVNNPIRKKSAQGTLLCGMRALNHVMVHRGRTPVDRDILDDIAHHVAAMETATGTGRALTTPHAEGNYHITVLSLALKQLADVFVHAWTDAKHADDNFGYIIGNGNHWQALLRTPD